MGVSHQPCLLLRNARNGGKQPAKRLLRLAIWWLGTRKQGNGDRNLWSYATPLRAIKITDARGKGCHLKSTGGLTTKDQLEVAGRGNAHRFPSHRGFASSKS